VDHNEKDSIIRETQSTEESLTGPSSKGSLDLERLGELRELFANTHMGGDSWIKSFDAFLEHYMELLSLAEEAIRKREESEEISSSVIDRLLELRNNAPDVRGHYEAKKKSHLSPDPSHKMGIWSKYDNWYSRRCVECGGLQILRLDSSEELDSRLNVVCVPLKEDGFL